VRRGLLIPGAPIAAKASMAPIGYRRNGSPIWPIMGGAAPVVAGSDVWTSGSTSAGSHTITFGAGVGTVAAGDALLIVVTYGVTGNTVGLTGYTEILSRERTAGSTEGMSSWVKTAAGGETSATLNFTSNSKATAEVYRITGGDVANIVAAGADGATNTPDPPAITITSGDWLFIAAAGVGNPSGTWSADPTNYANPIGTTTTGGSAATNTTSRTTDRSVTGSGTSEDPSAYTSSLTVSWVAMTIGVPAAAGASPQTVVANHIAVAVTMQQPKLVQVVQATALTVAVTMLSPSLVQVTKPPSLAVGVTMHAPTVIGPQSIDEAHLAVVVTMHAPQVVYQIQAGSITAAVTLYSPAVVQQIKPPALAVPVTLFTPTLVGQVKPPLLSVAVTLYAPTLVAQIKAAALSVPVTVHNPTVTQPPGPQTVAAQLLSVAVSLHNPTIALGGTPQTVLEQLLTATVTMHAPVVQRFAVAPTLIHVDGFEHRMAYGGYNTGDGVYDYANAAGYDAPGRESRGAALRVDSSGAGAYFAWDQPNLRKTLVESFYIRFATALPTADRRIAFVTVDTGSRPELGFQASSGRLFVRLGTGTKTLIGPVLVVGSWYLVDLYIDTSTSTRRVKARVNGGTDGEATGAIAAADITRFWLGDDSTTMPSGSCNYDDWCESSTLADYPIGEHRVYAAVPNGDVSVSGSVMKNQAGATINGTTVTAWNLINEFPPEETDYAKQVGASSTAYAEVSLEDLVELPIWAVAGFVALKATGAGTEPTKTRLVKADGTLLYDLFSEDQGTTTKFGVLRMFPTQPTSWNDIFNGIKGRIGFGTSTDSQVDPIWLALMLMYAVPSGASAIVLSTLSVPVTMHQPSLSVRIAPPGLQVGVTMHDPSVATTGTQTIPEPLLTATVVMHQPRVVTVLVVLAHLSVPVTAHNPAVGKFIVPDELVVAVSLFGPKVKLPFVYGRARVGNRPIHFATAEDRSLHHARAFDRAVHHARTGDRRG
jgi:hypothetical protein